MAKIKRLQSEYAEIPNKLLNSKNISLKSKGLWAFMQSKSEDWNFTIASMSKQLKEDERAIMTAMKELKEFGWLHYKKYNDGSGDYILTMGNDEPNLQNEDKPNPQNSNMLKQQCIIKKDDLLHKSILKIKMSDIEISEDKLKLITPKFEIELPEKDIQCFRAAETFRKVFIKNLKNRNAPTRDQDNANYKNYVTQIRLMREVDKITDDQIALAYDYLNSDIPNFWQETIQSPSNLRKNITRVLIDCNKKTPKKGSN